MNKQEAIERIESGAFTIEDTDLVVGLSYTKNIINQIDEQQKVVVPAFIDSFIGYAKAEGMSLFIAMDNAQNKESEWVIKHEDTFARAWLDGYEIGQEKLYTVEIPDPYGLYKIRYLFRNSVGNIRIGGNNYRYIFLNAETHLTEAEIKQDFEWAWQLAKEVE